MSKAFTFSLWSTSVRVATHEDAALVAATAEVKRVLERIEMASSRFRKDSELNLLRPGVNRISATLADLVSEALHAARVTEGLVDPTVGGTLTALGYDRSIEQIEPDGPAVSIIPAVPGWAVVSLEKRRLRVPQGVLLDLGATAKARASDLAAASAAARVGSPVLVGIGGDIATAGAGPDQGWQIRVQDSPEDPACQVTLAPGSAIATSSTVRRAWRRGGRTMHHIVDPRTAAPALPAWRSVTVAGPTCIEANAASTAAVVLGHRAVTWLSERAYAARLVDQHHRVVRVGDWPMEVPA